MNWSRVNRQFKCPVCQHDHWCTYNDDVVLCMWIHSDRPVHLKSGETGWLHPIGTKPQLRPNPKPAPPSINARKIWSDWHSCGTGGVGCRRVSDLAELLGLSASSLMDLETAWSRDRRAWAWPMWDGFSNMVGIRLRSDSGKKWAVPGSHAGIFIPVIKPQPTILITEGPTDTAAALSLGYYAIGRPSCSGGSQHIANFARRTGARRMVIVADSDGPGVKGAEMIQQFLPCSSCVITLPAKDVREFLNLGGTQELIDSIINKAVWRNV